MKLRSFVRMAVIVSVVLFCGAFAVFSYLRLHAVDRAKDFNLYTLVPPQAIAVLEANRMADLVEEINQMQCSKDQHLLNFSELFACLKNYLTTWVNDNPHGLSKQMNKMLLSFHSPDNPLNQVLYCTLGADDGSIVEAFIRKYASTSFPPKKFEYRNEEIYIYPLSDGRFLAAYFTPDFLAVSFQKRLIEQVIDAFLSGQSLYKLPSFRSMYKGRHEHVSATVYLRMKQVEMGNEADSVRLSTRVGCWAEFDLKFGEQVIYSTGVSHDTDTVPTFIHALQQQKPVSESLASKLPLSTFFHNSWAISDKRSILNFTSRQEYGREVYSDYVKERDLEWSAFLDGYAGNRIMSCLFLPKDTANHRPCAVMSLPVNQPAEAERRLRQLLNSTPREVGVTVPSSFSREYGFYPKARGYQQYLLPRNTLLTQLTGITESAYYTYACFYKGELLLAPDARSISAYIDALERGETLEGEANYEEGFGSLSSQYNYLMMVDMEMLSVQPDSYVRLVPSFFFRHVDFFRHFLTAVQFTCTDGVVSPNIVLLYK